MAAAATRCSPAAAPPRPVRIPRVRVRCCEDTLGVPRSRRPTHDTELAQSQRFPELVTPYGAASYLPHQQRYPPPPRPRRIVLVRHGESEGNVDEAAYTRLLELDDHSPALRFDALSSSLQPPLHVATCAVCLRDFHKSAQVRRAHRCRHVFHRACLDAWAHHGHRTCPLCRSPLLPSSAPPVLLPLPLPAS
ncbi:hypothetical protein OsI_21330 [Oryza sativa Indica Group]|uniref:RING-type domain-containing protein n=1 Tax=Oryza sativa subsp. indica TaxID=39946 RepID=B8B1J4_ORYSI|nr:hypothetical protein OsI_21330 [Oryza sativa Indica Group]